MSTYEIILEKTITTKNQISIKLNTVFKEDEILDFFGNELGELIDYANKKNDWDKIQEDEIISDRKIKFIKLCQYTEDDENSYCIFNDKEELDHYRSFADDFESKLLETKENEIKELKKEIEKLRK